MNIIPVNKKAAIDRYNSLLQNGSEVESNANLPRICQTVRVQQKVLIVRQLLPL